MLNTQGFPPDPRVRAIHISVEGYACLDELHEYHFPCHLCYGIFKGWRTFRDLGFTHGGSRCGSPSRSSFVNVKEPSPAAVTKRWAFIVEVLRPESVTKRAERAIGGARAACFEQPEGVYSGCVDAKQTRYTTC